MKSSGGNIFGYSTEAWENAKLEGICAIVRAGRKGGFIFYSDLVKQITSIGLEQHSYAMDRFLDEISKEEDAAGRGILTALVILKIERKPAPGFWLTAADVGRDVKNKELCWSNEVTRVLAECPNHPLCR